MADEKKAKKTSEIQSDKKSDKKKSGKNPFKSIGSFFKSVRSEGKKVVWPKPLEVLKNTIVVLVVILILGVIIFGIDQALTQSMKGIKKLAEEKTTAAAETDGETSEDALSDLLNGITTDDTDSEDAEDAEASSDTDAADTEATEDSSADDTAD